MSQNYVADQFVGTAVNEVNLYRQATEMKALLSRDHSFARALNEIQKVRDFVGSPENILGSQLTKHGEIAEHVEVGITNARSYMQGGAERATFEGVGRTAPADYILDGIEVQSKFLNGINNTLGKGLSDHLEKYPNFTQDGGFYHIPKDQFSVIDKILKGEHVDGLHQRTIDTIKAKVREIETSTGDNFYNVVKPGASNYGEVQLGTIDNTLDTHEQEFSKENVKLKEEISEAHKASLTDGLKAAGVAAAVGGTLYFTSGLYQHYKNGKNPFRGGLTVEDWNELGIDTAKGAAIGGVTGGVIYGLTNYASLSAPFAAAVVSAGKSLSSLTQDYRNGHITSSEFTDMGLIICAESAIVGLATAAGQTLIPVPILGAVIGSLAGQVMINVLGNDSGKAISQINAELKEFLNTIEDTYQQVVEKILDDFRRLGDLTVAAFDFELNYSLLNRSVMLAQAYGVENEKILKNSEEVDSFFLA